MATTHCAQCKREIALLAKFCPYCGAPVSELGMLAPPASSQPEPVGRLYEIAYRQKLVLYALLLNIVTLVANLVVKQFPESTTTQLLFTLIALVMMGQSVFYIWAWYKLGIALGISQVKIWLGAVCLILPCFSLIALLIMISRATAVLQAAGVHVGLLGANLSTIPKDS
ncbi:MAG TPA: zinc ribbon domain-containing protein [Pirellulales bacterium]